MSHPESPPVEKQNEEPPPMPSYPPYPKYEPEPVPATVADVILMGQDIRYTQKSHLHPPKVKQVPKPAKPKDIKATMEVKLTNRQRAAHARCLRRYGAMLTERLEQISKPRQRRIICMWRENQKTLPVETIARLRALLDADEPFKPDQAFNYFLNLRKSKKKSAPGRRKKESKKDVMALCEDKRYEWARNAAVAFARGIQQRLVRPGMYTLQDEMLRLSDIILRDICSFLKTRTPSRYCTQPKARLMTEIADKIAVWIDEVLQESEDRMLMMDFDENDEVEKFVNAGGFEDDFLNMMGGGGLLKGPTSAYLNFNGNMMDAFETLTETMYKKGEEPFIRHGLFKQNYKEAADLLKETPNFIAKSFNVELANDIEAKLTDCVKDSTLASNAAPMKRMIRMCSNFLAENAEHSKQKGDAFKILVKCLKEAPKEKLFEYGKIKQSMGQAANDLQSAKGFRADHDDPNLSQKIHSAMKKKTEGKVPKELEEEMKAERGPAFDLLIKELEASGHKSFAPQYKHVKNNHAAAFVIKQAPGLSVASSDAPTEKFFRKALHDVVDKHTPPNQQAEMDDVIDRCSKYLSSFVKTRDEVMNILLNEMKNKSEVMLVKRKDYEMAYKNAANELESAPNLVSHLPLSDISDEVKDKLDKLVQGKTNPSLEKAMQTATKDAGKYLSQVVALQSGVAGPDYAMDYLTKVMESLEDKPLYNYQGLGQTYKEAAESLKYMDNDHKTPHSVNPELQNMIHDEIKSGMGAALSPTVQQGLQSVMGEAAKALASIGDEKGKAMKHLLNMMKQKGDAPLSVLQGYEQTYNDGARRIENSPTLANNKVEKAAYENVRNKLIELADQNKESENYATQLPGIIDDCSKFLASPPPSSEAEKRSVLADIMSRKGDEILAQSGDYKLTYTSGGKEIMNAPVGKTTSANPANQIDIYRNINALISDKRLQDHLKDTVDVSAAYLADVVTGRGEALDALADALKKGKTAPLIKVGEYSKTYEQGAEMLKTASNLSPQPAHPALQAHVKEKIDILKVGPLSDLAAKEIQATKDIASNYIAGESTTKSGLSASQLSDLVGLDGRALIGPDGKILPASAGGVSVEGPGGVVSPTGVVTPSPVSPDRKVISGAATPGGIVMGPDGKVIPGAIVGPGGVILGPDGKEIPGAKMIPGGVVGPGGIVLDSNGKPIPLSSPGFPVTPGTPVTPGGIVMGPDGKVIQGAVVRPDGVIVGPDGKVIQGAVVIPGGVVGPGGLVMGPDGKVITGEKVTPGSPGSTPESAGVVVMGPDGKVIKGAIVRPDGVVVGPDGTVIPGAVVVSGGVVGPGGVVMGADGKVIPGGVIMGPDGKVIPGAVLGPGGVILGPDGKVIQGATLVTGGVVGPAGVVMGSDGKPAFSGVVVMGPDGKVIHGAVVGPNGVVIGPDGKEIPGAVVIPGGAVGPGGIVMGPGGVPLGPGGVPMVVVGSDGKVIHGAVMGPKGEILGPDGKVIPGAKLIPSPAGSSGTQIVGSDGKVIPGAVVGPGGVILGPDGKIIPGAKVISIAPGSPGLQIVGPDGKVIPGAFMGPKGEILGPDGKVIPGAKVIPIPADSSGTVIVGPDGKVIPGAVVGPGGVILGPDGKVIPGAKVISLAPGSPGLQIVGADGKVIPGAFLGPKGEILGPDGKVIPGAKVIPSPADSSGTQIVGPDGKVIPGAILGPGGVILGPDGKVIPGAKVIPSPADSSATVIVGPDGKVIPGAVVGPGGVILGPDGKVIPGAKVISLAPGSSGLQIVGADGKVIPGAFLGPKGEILGPDGKVIPGAKVIPTPADTSGTVIVGPDGKIIPGAVVGPGGVILGLDGKVIPGAKVISIAPGSPGLQIVGPDGKVIPGAFMGPKGEILGPDGKVIPGAKVIPSPADGSGTQIVGPDGKVIPGAVLGPGGVIFGPDGKVIPGAKVISIAPGSPGVQIVGPDGKVIPGAKMGPDGKIVGPDGKVIPGAKMVTTGALSPRFSSSGGIGSPGSPRSSGALRRVPSDESLRLAVGLLHRSLEKKGDDVLYQQQLTTMTHKDASDWIKKEPITEADSIVKDSTDTARLATKLEKKLNALVTPTTPEELKETMQDVIIEKSRLLSEKFVGKNYKALVNNKLITEMQKKGNEILVDVDGKPETYFYSAQRLKRAEAFDTKETCPQVAHYLNKKLDDLMKGRPLPRKLVNLLKEQTKAASNYLSSCVTLPDDEISAYVALLEEMEARGDQPLVAAPSPRTYNDGAKYLSQLTSFEDTIRRKNNDLKTTLSKNLKSIMPAKPTEYEIKALDSVIDQCSTLLTSYFMLQGQKTEALQVLIDEMDRNGDSVLLRHGELCKKFKEGADRLRDKNADQIGRLSNVDPVVARKISLKLEKLMKDITPPAFENVMPDVIEESTLHLAAIFLHPHIIRVCKCMKNVFVQCELWCDEILRHVSRPCCTCSRKAPADNARCSVPEYKSVDVEVSFRPCKNKALCPNMTRQQPSQDTANNYPSCNQNPTTSYVLHSITYDKLPFQNNATRSRVEPTRDSSPLQRIDEIDVDICTKLPRKALIERPSRGVRNTQLTRTEPTRESGDKTLDLHDDSSKWKMLWQTASDIFSNTSMHVNQDDVSMASTLTSNLCLRTPIVTTEEMSDWHGMVVSLMWNMQAWRRWIQDNIDLALRSRNDLNFDNPEYNWIPYEKRVSTEALQWRQYNLFSRQLTLRLALRYKNKRVVSPTRATDRTEEFMRRHKEMLEVIDMFRVWTQWLSSIIQKSNSLKASDASTSRSLNQRRWNNFRGKVEEYAEHWHTFNMYLKSYWEQDNIKLLTGWMDSWEPAGAVWVVSACGAVPSGAVSCGYMRGEPTWLARTTHRRRVLPGTLHPSKHCCIVYAEGSVHHYNKYQVLCNANVDWLSWHSGDICPQAVCIADGVYAGRVLYHGSHLLGPVLAPHYRCHVVLFGKALAFNCYELLALKEED